MDNPTKFDQITRGLRLPVAQAPMFLISGPDMVIEAARAGILGSFPTQNARTVEQLEDWFEIITNAVTGHGTMLPWSVNLIVHPTNKRREADLELIKHYRPPIVITALGSPAHIIDEVHAYGGMVFADVINPYLARKAVAAGVDGLVLICAGAGGHTGYLSPFAFVDTVREFWNGPLIVGGGIATGRGIRAVQAVGADLAYLGTRFLATTESMAQAEYKRMVVESTPDDIVASASITGVKANWLRESLVHAGYDPDDMPDPQQVDVTQAIQGKRWKDIWAAGQSVGPVHGVHSMRAEVNRLAMEFDAYADESPHATDGHVDNHDPLADTAQQR